MQNQIHAPPLHLMFIYTKIIYNQKISNMKQLFLFLSFISISCMSHAQLTKGNWLVGGNGSFSSASYSNTIAASYTQTNLQISPTAGYFFSDKFAAGLRPGYAYTKTSITGNSNDYSLNTLSIGPFVRYYFLQLENRLNIFSELNYQYVTSKTKDNPSTSYNAYSILAGPVIYFNQSVGLEFTVGYSTAKFSSDASSKNSTLQFGIGLQVHLEKDN